jgi:glycosyltransferase involved in cell wall biosynthesis
MKVVHTVSSIDNPSAGPSYTVPRLAQSLAKHGCAVELFTLGAPESAVHESVRITRCAPDQGPGSILAKLGRSRAMREAVLASKPDILHTHGLWMMPNVYPSMAARRFGKPLVLAPRGMLGRDALKFSSAAKHGFWQLWQKRAVDAVACFHATAESEYDDIRNFGLKQPVAIIANGIDLPVLSDLGTDLRVLDSEVDRNPFILAIGRIHPKKGLDRLIAAFCCIALRHPSWILRIVGPDEGGHAATLKRQVAASGLDERITFELPVFGRQKLCLMRQAGVFALPSLHENFGMTVAECLAIGTPVISTRGAPWAGLPQQGCGWWIDHGIEAMSAALCDAMSTPALERKAMGARGREWMQRDFAWDGIGAKMAYVYEWLAGNGARPSWVEA